MVRLTVHLVWVKKYRYSVLKGEIQNGCRELIMQICETEDVNILKGVVSKNHVHRHVKYSPAKSILDLIQRIKGRTSRLLQQEYPELQKQYWGKPFFDLAGFALSHFAT